MVSTVNATVILKHWYNVGMVVGEFGLTRSCTKQRFSADLSIMFHPARLVKLKKKNVTGGVLTVLHRCKIRSCLPTILLVLMGIPNLFTAIIYSKVMRKNTYFSTIRPYTPYIPMCCHASHKARNVSHHKSILGKSFQSH